jgi:hypothetical protein
MSSISLFRTSAAVAIFATCALGAVVAPDYAPSYTAFDLGSVTGLPARYGGLVFRSDNPNVILIGGHANEASGQLYSVPVNRDASSHITGFGTASVYSSGAYNDGGI